VADKVMNWIGRGKPTKEFKRGERKGYRGTVWLHDWVIEKGGKSGQI